MWTPIWVFCCIHTVLDILSFIDMCLFRKNSYHIILNWILLYSMDYSSSASDFIVHPVSESRGGSLSVTEEEEEEEEDGRKTLCLILYASGRVCACSLRSRLVPTPQRLQNMTFIAFGGLGHVYSCLFSEMVTELCSNRVATWPLPDWC